MSRLQLRGVGVRFGELRALDAVDLDVGPGQILGLTGPSGAGKSTLCRVVAGLQRTTAGDVCIGGTAVDGVPTERRGAAVMFESYALYPHLTVFENIVFPLLAPTAPRLASAAIAERVRTLMRLVELDGLEKRRPGQLSGGQRQRVALSRALVQQPRVFVLDEPISHLDAKLRHQLRGAVRRRLLATDVPTVWTSPDMLEALAVADTVAVLVRGRVHQVGSPAEVYARPATLDVARLLGDPPMNLLHGSVEDAGGAVAFRHPAFRLVLPAAVAARLQAGRRREAVVMGLRPGEITVGDTGVAGRVWVWEPLGKSGVLTVGLGADRVKVKLGPRRMFRPDEPITLELAACRPALFDAATGEAI